MKAIQLLSGAQLVLAVTVIAFGATEMLRPPFTDQEIRASFVDTWEVSAITTFATLVVLGSSALLSAFVAWNKRSHLALATFAFTLVAGALMIYNHAQLTHRTTALTGQTFGTFYGLL